MQTFDHTTLTDEAIRAQYERLLKRSRNAADAVSAAYGAGRKPIHVRYAVMGDFNAGAYAEADHYQIDIASNVPMLILMLFHKIFQDPEVFYWLESEGEIASDFQVPFILDLKHQDRRTNWSIQLSEDRAFGARMVADMINSFIAFHEIGHIASGHCEAIQDHEGRNALLEFDSHMIHLPEAIERRQSWEADADAFGCTMLVEYVGQFLKEIDGNDRMEAVFKVPEKQVEHILAIAAAGLFALFFYTRGQEKRLRVTSVHADPYVRAMYAKDMIISAATTFWGLDLDIFQRLLTARATEFLDALENQGIFDGRYFDGKHFDRIDHENDRVSALRIKYRHTAAPWSWIDWF